MTKRAIAVAVVCLAVLAGCNSQNNTRGKGDAPVKERHEDPRQVWNNIDTFPNVVAFCIGANGAYTTTRDGVDLVVIPDDPNCKTDGALYAPESGSQG